MSRKLLVRKDNRYTKPREFKFTTSDGKLPFIKKKIFIFRKTWVQVKQSNKDDRNGVFWKAYKDEVSGTDFADEAIATDLLENVYMIRDRMKMLKDTEEYLWNIQDKKSKGDPDKCKMDLLLFGTEMSFERAFKNLVDTRTNISSDEYIIRLMNDTRLCLFLIGREFEWKHESKTLTIRLPGDIHETLCDLCNPITQSLKLNVRDHLKDLERSGKLTVCYENETYDPNMEKVDKEDIEVNLHKSCLPANIAIAHHVSMEIFHNMLDSFKRLNDIHRMVNLANVLMVFMFCFHEGARPGDTIRGQRHSDIYFWLNGVQYPIIVLAFVKIDTLVTLMKSGELLRYTCDFYKGKTLRKRRSRVKSWIPISYNSLDLPTIYILTMRLLACLNINCITNMIFSTSDHNKLVNRLKVITNNMGIQKCTFYSLRCAAAEDDKQYHIPTSWSRYRMGHTNTSLMLNRYANNLNQRVIINDTMTLLGCDVQGTNGCTENSVLPIFFKEREACIKSKSNVSDDILSELKQVNDVLQPFLKGKSSVKSVMCNKLYVASNKKQLLEDFRKVPLGSEFIFMNELLPESTEYIQHVENTKENLKSYFDSPNSTDEKIGLWSYPQIIYGEWNKDMFEDAMKVSDEAYKRQQNCVTLYETAAIQLGINPEKQTQKRVFNLSNDEKPVIPKKARINGQGTSKQINTNAQWWFDKIEKNDVVALKCDVIRHFNNDSYNITVPRTTSEFIIMHVLHVDIPNMTMKGRLYKGGVHGLVLDNEKYTIKDVSHTSILWIWCLDKGEKASQFVLNKDDITNIRLALQV
jgi:hypothetical protein